ncbi:MAG: hypothetical protein AABY22_02670 [Nanoarchaeota archaeon]
MSEPQEKIKIIVEKVKPSAIAQACPVCNTFGTLGYAKKVCHGCDGKGYILIPTDKEKNEKV